MNRLLRVLPVLSLLLLAAGLSRAAEVQTVTLTNGTTLVGEVVGASADHLTLKDAVLGTLNVPLSAIKSRSGGAIAAAPTATPTPASAPSAGGNETPVATAGATTLGGSHGAHASAPPSGSNQVHWTRGVQINIGYMSGAAPDLGIDASRNIGVNFVLERATPKHIASLTGSYNHGQAKPAPPYVDNISASFQYDYIFNEKYRFVSRTTAMRDRPKLILHRTEELAGIATTLIRNPKTLLMVAPGLGYSFGQKDFASDMDNQHVGLGAYQIFNHAFTPTLSFEQTFFFFQSLEDSNYLIYNGSIGLKTQITKTLSLMTTFHAVFDGEPAPGIEKLQYQTNTGIQIKF